ncbi:uncharacterized protein LOC115580348 [Sparus aurata]|uniref:uncharacterized protein LOC115580348 n=1 Tax=Sparus aurata TaxID=8175 RepID=UPI0011C0F186|nr:uncharacterized protein LOC115580348 [Sparus aurata]
MAEKFKLDTFVAHPTAEQVQRCRKDDLLEIATHFNIPCIRAMLKKEIRERVIGGLVEQGAITLTEQMESVPLPSSSAEAESGPSTETPAADEKVSQAGERGKTPFTLPRYDPSPQSSTGHTEARLKVRLARLQLEARERETQSQLQLQLEIRKAELQAETERAVRLRQLELEASNMGQSAPRDSVSAVSRPSSPPRSSNPRGPKEERECYYCHQVGHVIANCLTLKRKEQSSRPSPAKGVGLIKADCGVNIDSSDQKIDDCFKPFVFDAFVSLTGESADKHPIRALRDTACSQSVILASALPFSDNSACHYSLVLRGVEMGYMPRPVHRVYIQSTLVTGSFPVAVCTELPIPGIVLLMGNDIAGDDKEKKKEAESSLLPVQDASAKHTRPTGPELPLAGDAAFPVSRACLSQMQKADPTLRECFTKVIVVPAGCRQHIMSVAHERMAGYYRSYCRNFSSIAFPLTSLLSTKVDYVWTTECQDSS